MKRAGHLLTFIMVICFFAGSADASWIPERRKPQFETNFAYAVFPYPYSLPGIGSGLGLVGGAININETTTDVYGIIFGGDVHGIAGGVADVPLVPEHLLMDFGYSSLSAATIMNYSQRGMNSDKNDFTLIELGDATYYGSRLTATFFDRRFEVYGAYYQGSSQVKSVRDNNGNLIFAAQNAQVERGHVNFFGTRFDLTDDYADPRRGVRLDFTRWNTPPRDSGPDFYEQIYNATGYVPFGGRSTWVFNYYQADAHVNRQGATTAGEVAENLGLTGCTDERCTQLIDNTIANNIYGTASSLGGFNRLRSYPAGRFKGAHTLFYGTEIRWNLTDETTPYDLFLMRDVRTAWQIAAFYEAGTVADKRSDLGDIWRSSAGIGLRMVGASGVVFRADIATGREGIAPSIFIGYPWEL